MIKNIAMAGLIILTVSMIGCGGGSSESTGGAGNSPVLSAATYTISGSVTSTSTGTGMSGLTMNLHSGSSGTITTSTDANGAFDFTGLVNDSYTVSPPGPGLHGIGGDYCTPSFQVVLVNGSNVENVNFTCTPGCVGGNGRVC